VVRSDELVVVTGGIGSGKSAVLRCLEELNWHVLDADAVAQRVLVGLTDEIATRWPDAITGHRHVDRGALAELVFSNPQELKALESLIYPSLERELEDWLVKARKPAAVEISSPRYALRSEWFRIVVDSADHIRRTRLIARGMNQDDLERRASLQPTRGEWLTRAEAIVDNSQSPPETYEAVALFDRYWRKQ
jgi:dephospho-CoA kinase